MGRESFPAAQNKFRLANFITSTSWNSIVFNEFVQDMNTKSNGKLEISYYTESTLLTASKMAAGIATVSQM
jgi:TRAP-type C4-dicarboxylate transport system substrate-binding protein